jgi:hypothetical protein
MIFWSLCAFIWFRNMKKMLLQMTSVSLQPVPSLDIVLVYGEALGVLLGSREFPCYFLWGYMKDLVHSIPINN